MATVSEAEPPDNERGLDFVNRSVAGGFTETAGDYGSAYTPDVVRATAVPLGPIGLPAIDTLPLQEQADYWAGVVARGENTATPGVIGVPTGISPQVREMAILGDDLSGSPLGPVFMNEGTGDQTPYGALGRVVMGPISELEHVGLGMPADYSASIDGFGIDSGEFTGGI